MASFLTLFLLFFVVPVAGKDFGVHGHTFPIEEESLIDFLTKQIGTLTQQDILGINKKLQKHYKQLLNSPAPVKNLLQATKYLVHYFDPSISAKQEIKDEQGNIIVAKGSVYNPLHHFPLPEELLFFDGDDPSQLNWAKSQGEHKKWILVSGHPLRLEEMENRPVYFDQNGLLTQKLSIVAIPARVSQEGQLLKIEAVPMEEKGCD